MSQAIPPRFPSCRSLIARRARGHGHDSFPIVPRVAQRVSDPLLFRCLSYIELAVLFREIKRNTSTTIAIRLCNLGVVLLHCIQPTVALLCSVPLFRWDGRQLGGNTLIPYFVGIVRRFQGYLTNLSDVRYVELVSQNVPNG